MNLGVPTVLQALNPPGLQTTKTWGECGVSIFGPETMVWVDTLNLSTETMVWVDTLNLST